MRASRLLSLLIMLQLRGRVSAREMADRFEVSKRTIYRDVDELSAAGVPIYAERGAAGGFALLDGWQTRLTGMTSGEAEAMLLAGLPIAAAELGLGETAAAARLKLLAALPRSSSEAAQRVADRLHLDPTPWHRRPATPRGDLRLLARATWECRRLRLRYESWTGTTVRVVDPLGIISKAGEWYFVARRGGRSMIHKLDKAAELVLLDETFERPADFDLAAEWRNAVDAFEKSLRKQRACLRVSERAMSRLDRLGADIVEAVTAVRPDREGWREADVPIEGVSFMASQLLGFADDIEVLAPDELRREVSRRALAVVAIYGDLGLSQPPLPIDES